MARRTGMSTRLIDNAIQELFIKGATELYGENFEELEYHYNRLVKRMAMEHSGARFRRERIPKYEKHPSDKMYYYKLTLEK